MVSGIHPRVQIDLFILSRSGKSLVDAAESERAYIAVTREHCVGAWEFRRSSPGRGYS
jgi:hypothetical protein